MPGLPFIEGVTPERPALADDSDGGWLSYGDLAELAWDWASRMSGPRGLVFVYARNDRSTVASLIGALAAGHVVALFDPNLSEGVRTDLEEAYRPTWVIGPESGLLAHPGGQPLLHPDLGLLLSTSGSTGSAKLVRLTLGAMRANAAAIGEVLDIGGEDVGAGHLPLHYSYGLSVLTSHLARGARIRLTDMRLTDRAFWPAVREAGITHMPGVPFHYQIMRKLGLKRLNLPSLRVMTQAGGALDSELRQQVHDFMQATGGRFFVLYGQTEAAPRMTTLQHEDFPFAPQSVGTPLPGCRIEIRDPDASGHGEVIFSGPNVMLGYAESRDDLERGDELGGQLPTGDIGLLDDAGRLTLTGRVKRIGKLYGLRINLDEVEMLTNGFATTAVTQKGDSLTVHIATTGDTAADEALQWVIMAGLQDRFTVPPTSYRFHFAPAIPRTERGKIDYSALEAQA